MTGGKGVDRVCMAGGTVSTFEEAVKALKPGGRIGNVNYLGSGEFVTIPRVEWGAGMGHKVISGGLMPGGRLRMEKLGSLVSCGRLDVSPPEYPRLPRLGSHRRGPSAHESQARRPD